MKIFDSSSWVIRHFYQHVPVDKAFASLFNHDKAKSVRDWFYFLEDQGMLPLSRKTKRDWIKWRKSLNKEELTTFLLALKKDFSGPDADVFLFPLNQAHQRIMKELGGKNGCSFPSHILLFWKDTLPVVEQKAVLLHEYHHVARLYYQEVNEGTISLLESMIMEGLAEWEVQTRLGSACLAPWTSLYNENELLTWWEKVFRNNIHLKGRAYHYPFLYGGEKGLPPLIGYQLGYYLVQSYMKDKGGQSSLTMLKTSAEHFLLEKS
ncbi:hypothetical protein CR194_10145 [Salipaludibacillus keqinensis]|uniref:DUF2268 domain-containing protein n=1 Tax=Salipaludibacillus keqinensis TaxID=2045207 RepID=A0A323TGC2_9BACI|nr:DUF2268 domain-containing putative Zn-dependent protease [Salipaludibacillus keqinensis]PYZ93520.1 hypothetical protein CR194_10145 [Salipaludibacillus keqinensis]